MTQPIDGVPDFSHLELIRCCLMARALDRAAENLAGSAALEPPRDRRDTRRTDAAIGAAFALQRRMDGMGDVMAPAVGTPAAVLAMRIEPEEYLRQVMGSARSFDKGRGPRFHWFDPDRGVLGPTRPAGTSIQVMAGVTLSFRMRSQDRVGLVISGGEECTTAAWHEGLNFASVRRCPIVVVVEQPRSRANAAGRGHLPGQRSTRLDSWLDVCDGYGMRGHVVLATDPVRVRDGIGAALRLARSGEGVQLVELRGDGPEAGGEGRSDPAWIEGIPEPVLHRVTEEVRSRAEQAVRSVRGDDGPDPAVAHRAIPDDGESDMPWYRSPTGREGFIAAAFGSEH